MKLRFLALNALTLVLLFAVIAIPASAGTLYEDGPINGTVDAWTINFGFVVSDTFTISTGTSQVTGMAFGAWLFPGDILETVQLSITSQEFGGTTYFDQVVSFTGSNCSLNQYGYNVCEESGMFNGPTLPDGTYWMNLQNAVVNTGDPVYWDENSGIGCHSQGCPSQPSQNTVGTIPPESFTILGTASAGTTPEPSSLWLFGGGAIGLAGMLRRKLLKEPR